ncbi:hypothetical protein BN946_scf184851.g32 [Trametes cinnabarina]|uniref:N-acetyltransferase domain-containing protein n=1 Tax=Pycnoporus cinnabarinus TaxID=5643 RepID=A0A060SBH5_PYCCI|nr:hypothetical protein BN946_scf184851.g32 [Trametes cinnabarina]
MGSESEWDSSESVSDYYEAVNTSIRSKRRKLTQKGRTPRKRAHVRTEIPEPRPFSLDPLLKTLHENTAKEWENQDDMRDSFEVFIEPHLHDYLDAEKQLLRSRAETDENTTPYESSFLSRLQGVSVRKNTGVIAIDWEARPPWMELMNDIREHYALAHPELEQAVESEAPITYCSLQASHLSQVHDLLARVFWEGIDVSDALDYSPEKCTVVAMYKRLVVGAAFLSSPQETYITYLAVRAGWDNSQIATSMLYHLITLNPNKDITLHVSINNPAMLLYNRFGFKAEEFIVGFYEDYLDPNSLQSKNAFRLRLRR